MAKQSSGLKHQHSNKKHPALYQKLIFCVQKWGTINFVLKEADTKCADIELASKLSVCRAFMVPVSFNHYHRIIFFLYARGSLAFVLEACALFCFVFLKYF